MTQVFENLQALPNANGAGYHSGVAGAFDQSEAYGRNAQQGFVITNGTYCSVIPQASTTGEVTITFQ